MYELITYGAGDKFWEFFNGLAAVVGDSSYISIVQIAVLFAFAMGIFQAAFNIQLRPILHWFFAFFLTFNIMLVPKVDLLITDRAMNDRQYVVANTPFGIALFVDTFSKIGDKLTRLTETVFTLPDDLKYHQSGTLMAASLIETASRFQVTSPHMAQNLDSFMQQCVQYDILLNKYTLDDVFNEGDLWQFFKETASPARAFLYNDDISTCKSGAEKLSDDWTAEIERAELIYGQRFFGDTLDPKASLLKYLPVSYQYMGNLSSTAADIMQQNMVINAFHDAVLNQGAQTGASAAVESYASARALQQQRAAYGISGRLATHTLPLLKSVIEVLVYGCFLLVVPIMLLPNSWSIIKNYILTLFWVQSWGPLYAVLNLFLNLETRRSLIGLIESPVLELSAITIANLPGVEQVASDRALMAAYLSMFVPVISFSLIMTGKAYFPLLATQIAGATQSAANTGAEEATSGNYNLGNLSLYNDNAYNASAYHTNRNLSYSAGMLSMQTSQGGQQVLSPDTEMLIDNTQSISKLNTSMNLGHRISDSLSQSYEETLTHAQNQMTSAYKSMSQAAHQAYEIGESHARIQQQDATWSRSESSSINQSAIDFKNQTDSLMSAHGWTYDEAMNAQVGASLGLNKGPIHLGLSGNKTFADSERENWDIASQSVEQQTIQNQIETALRGDHTDSERHTDEASSRSSESERTSFDEAMGYRDEAANSLSKAQSIREAMTTVIEESASLNSRADQLAVEAISQEINHDTGKAYTAADIAKIDARDPQRMKALTEKVVKNLAETFIKNPDANKATLDKGYNENKEHLNETAQKQAKSLQKDKKDQLSEEKGLENSDNNPLSYKPSEAAKIQLEDVNARIKIKEGELASKREQQEEKVSQRHRYITDEKES